MRNTKMLFLSFLCLCIQTNCSKKDPNVCTGGSGGNVTVVLFPKHHGKSVKATNAYIKYNSKDAPSSLAGYDLTAAGGSTAVSIMLSNLKCGDYYILATGYDTSISAAVKGGIPYSIGENESGDINVDVPVTE